MKCGNFAGFEDFVCTMASKFALRSVKRFRNVACIAEGWPFLTVGVHTNGLNE